MINRWLKIVVSSIFGVSALMKIIDFDNTVIYFQNIFGAGFEMIRYSLALIIFVEMVIAFTLPLIWRGQRIVQAFTFLIVVVFLGLSLTMAFTSVKNCGCFGTYWISHPWLTVAKNLVLIAILRYDFKENKYA